MWIPGQRKRHGESFKMPSNKSIKKEEVIDQNYLRSILHYDSITGEFTWKQKKYCSHLVGKRAGTVEKKHNSFHLVININYKHYYAHRLAWLYMTGSWPILDIDHIDLNGLNNKWNNLREATATQNLGNTKISKHNTSGYKGVHFSKKDNSWIMRLRHHKLNHCSYHKTKEEAAEAYRMKALELFGEYANFK